MNVERVLVSIAMILFILDFISHTFFKDNSSYATFGGLMLLSFSMLKMIDDKADKEKK
ncbi:hypothetical protein OYT88_07790 [Sporolactobacillus sp. CQH2019]|uniref:hypothetical protein n=1 Tax=Sporolactobacillus sp. CQH2019 TaxID=3023512 RepID=UPI0023685817|nr:hypothetical protein [Sporolactobacillus sp. CQH2019]MDD9148448.1 hypothetical protein [Sporolactobacillus sp. CQH2019]